MSSSGAARGQRLCSVCRKPQLIEAGEPVWPPGWVCPGCGSATPFSDGIACFAPALADTDEGFETAAFDFLVKVEAGHYWFQPRNRLLTGLAEKFFPSARTYLEVGCGTGFVLDAFASLRAWSTIVGAELHLRGLAHARRRLGTRATFVQMDARDVPARAAIDLVGAYDVIEHIAEDEAVLAGLHACLTPRGGIIVAVPQHPFLWSEADSYGHHVRRYRRGELESKLRAAGFEILFSSSYTTLLLPLMMASRLRRHKEASLDRIKVEFEISPVLNTLLRKCLELEVTATLRGARWAMGGSRVVVARKGDQRPSKEAYAHAVVA